MPPLLTRLAGKHFVLSGNGAMIEELAPALSDVGVARQFVHTEPYLNGSHVPEPEVVATIRERFVPDDLFSAFAHRESSLFAPERPLAATKLNVDPLAPSDVFAGPEFLFHMRRPEVSA